MIEFHSVPTYPRVGNRRFIHSFIHSYSIDHTDVEFVIKYKYEQFVIRYKYKQTSIIDKYNFR
jgi:hypothetical protein